MHGEGSKCLQLVLSKNPYGDEEIQNPQLILDTPKSASMLRRLRDDNPGDQCGEGLKKKAHLLICREDHAIIIISSDVTVRFIT